MLYPCSYRLGHTRTPGICHGRTGLTEIPGSGMNVVQNLTEVPLRVNTLQRTILITCLTHAHIILQPFDSARLHELR